MNTPRSLLTASTVALALLVAGCNTLPDDVAALQQAERAVEQLAARPAADNQVGTELDQARKYLAEARAAHDNGKELELIEHKAYMAQRYADIGAKRLASSELRQEISQAEAKRKDIVLRQQGRETELAREEARQYRRESEEMTAAAMSARAELDQLREQMAELDAKPTERGMVLTLGDVLFATNEAELREGAASTLNKLAAFMREYPERKILIEGHTDSTGSAEYNLGLSQQRAMAVDRALRTRGIESGRIEVIPLGEEYPVASNDTTAGRQQNRRVEIVISDQEGEFPADAYRETGVAFRSSAVFIVEPYPKAQRAALYAAPDRGAQQWHTEQSLRSERLVF